MNTTLNVHAWNVSELTIIYPIDAGTQLALKTLNEALLEATRRVRGVHALRPDTWEVTVARY